MSKTLIILDRDGCINTKAEEGNYIYQHENFRVYEDVIETLRHPVARKFKFAIATNQQGIAKGLYTEKEVKQLHGVFLDLVGWSIDDFPIFVCPHSELDKLCDCRKPKPGLLIEALNYYELKSNQAIFIGDSATDQEASSSASIDFCHLRRGVFSRSLELPTHRKYICHEISPLLFEKWAS